jgi:hypothetical protein
VHSHYPAHGICRGRNPEDLLQLCSRELLWPRPEVIVPLGHSPLPCASFGSCWQKRSLFKTEKVVGFPLQVIVVERWKKGGKIVVWFSQSSTERSNSK